MEQRTLRLGDLVDDYCPRERRLTNHVIVALVGQEIRRTRCSTCDAEHEFKEAQAPKKKLVKPEPTLAARAVAPAAVAVSARLASTNGRVDDPPAVAPPAAAAPPAANGQATDLGDGASPTADRTEGDEVQDGWLAHRPLIRATLPRQLGGEPPPRPIPEFTMHQRQGRPNPQGFRHGQPPREGNANGSGQPRDGEADGNRPSRSGRRRRRRRPRG
jgi:hypothetical protein